MICSMLVSALAPGVVGLAFGQRDASLADPTRPAVTASEPVASGAVDAAAPSGLQTIIIGRGRKPMAVINGIMVGLGDKIGEATLVKLSESEAVLLGPAGREVLQLLPGVAKNMDAASVKKVQGKTYDK